MNKMRQPRQAQLTRRYFGDVTSVDDLRRDFCIPDHAIQDAEVLFAHYQDDMGHATASILFRRARKLYEVVAYHCSCEGFIGGWNPQEVTWAQLAMRPKDYLRPYDTEHKAAHETLYALIHQHVSHA